MLFRLSPSQGVLLVSTVLPSNQCAWAICIILSYSGSRIRGTLSSSLARSHRCARLNPVFPMFVRYELTSKVSSQLPNFVRRCIVLLRKTFLKANLLANFNSSRKEEFEKPWCLNDVCSLFLSFFPYPCRLLCSPLIISS